MDAKLVVIVGETGSGKSNLALNLAKRFNGEVITADSRTIYKGMDIGTAKPSMADRESIEHHLVDIIEPNEAFNVGQFKKRAEAAIKDIQKRSKLPILVGGTGLYVDSVLFDYQFSPPGARRSDTNPRHLKYQELKAYQQGLRPNTLVLGLQANKDRLIERTAKMFQAGLETEVKRLAQKYGWDAPGLNTIGYQEFQSYVKGEATLQDVQKQIEGNTFGYAKRQRTWFKRNPRIQWVDDPSQAIELVTTFLNT